MRHLLPISAFCSALLFCASAIPCQAGVVIDFSNDGVSSTGSDISLASGSTIPSTSPDDDTVIGILTNFDLYNFGSGNVSGFFNESFCLTTPECMDLGISGGPALDTIYVTGTITALGITGSVGGTGDSAPLIAITLSGPLTGTSFSTSPFFTGYGPLDVSSIAVNPLLLADLGLTGATLSLAAADVNIGGSDGNYTITQSAAIELSTTSSTPEPGSWLLMTLGISLMIVFVAARRSSRAGQ
jgi:hypothetical protein